MAIDNTY